MTWFGDNVLALAWSFTNPLQEIPYRITRNNKNRLACTCPAFVHRYNCKHISSFRTIVKHRIEDDEYIRLTDYGKKVYGWQK